ncbi:MAG: ZIP family metal transporter [Deltaproteobacteria bacterium CG11_big_fil_rev_8_21_14_0_20_49_13]|nr:MAG: ZIP family metal transporter [Deltaproteobacteria bacterium CG11_big_fil_rev_8_21_14_0_20_49_13]
MVTIWLYTLLSVVVVSLLSLIGAFFLSVKDDSFRKILLYLVSFSTGSLFGDVFIHIFPEIARTSGFGITTSVSVLAGIFIFFALEKFIYWQHCHADTCEEHPHPVAYTNLFGDGMHNFIDGMIIAGSYLADVKLGLATTLAVVLHEIPTEMGHYSILIYAGFTKKKALWFNFLSALTAIVGGIVTLIAYKHVAGLTQFLLPLTAGGFIYLAGSDLIPELHKEHDIKKSLMQMVMIGLGVGLMFLMLIAE